MKTSMRELTIFFMIIITLVVGACGKTTPALTATATTIPKSTLVIPISTKLLSTPSFTFTPTFAYLPTLTPLPNSTPAGNGAYFDVPSDVLGPRYEIKNAYYFDDFQAGKRYEIYAGAVAGSGDEYTAQGAVVVHILRVMEKEGAVYVESIETIENLTSYQVGPLRIDGSDYKERYSGLLLRTSLDFVWFLNPYFNEMYSLRATTPLARLEAGGKTQVAKLKGDSPVFSTNPLPLTGQSPFTARLHLPLEQSPDALSLSAILVSPSGTLQYDGYVSEDRAEWHTDCTLCVPPIFRENIELGKLPLLHDQELGISLKPGFYILNIHATWLDTEWFGRIGATYAFLIEVRN